MVYTNRYSNHEQPLIGLFYVKAQIYKRRGRLKVNIHVLFYEDNSRTVSLRQMKFGAVKDMEIPTNFT
jgi:hypothetical protein